MPNLNDLPVQERINLVQDLWDSIAADTSAVPIDHDHLRKVKERLAAYRADLDQGERAHDVAEEIRKGL